jgi:hypothetical protein
MSSAYAVLNFDPEAWYDALYGADFPVPSRAARYVANARAEFSRVIALSGDVGDAVSKAFMWAGLEEQRIVFGLIIAQQAETIARLEALCGES